MSKISIVVPACNESSRLTMTLKSYIDTFSRFKDGDYEIIVVCNGCHDNTPQLATDYARDNAHIKVVNVPEKIGKGGAVKIGLEKASGSFCLFTDADGSTPAAETEKLVNAVMYSCDVAIGSRRLKNSKILLKQPLSRRVAGWAFNWIVRIIFGLPFRDTQCGAKAFRKEAIRDIIEQVKTNGFSFDVDLLWKLKTKGYRIQELPVIWKDSPGSTLNIYKHAPVMLSEILKLRFNGK